jgi:hypothetical protein
LYIIDCLESAALQSDTLFSTSFGSSSFSLGSIFICSIITPVNQEYKKEIYFKSDSEKIYLAEVLRGMVFS